MKKLFSLITMYSLCLFFSSFLYGQLTTVKIDKNITYQNIKGFGGFVCSPQFAYNHMSPSEIQTLWGTASEGGYNIMRLYIPEDSSNWSAVVPTAQLAKSMGLIIFASPWTMPAAWKTNNHVNAVYTDSNGVQQIGYLKPENYQDYALYLNSFVTFLQSNGVDLDYISIQNEPDEMAQYQGCIWTPTQMATFVKDYGHLINCKVIAPESVGFTDNFANAMLNTATMANFEVYGGHQYGLMQSAYKQFRNYNKEIWQTEYLINWNSGSQTPRDFNWNLDVFNFASSINNAMLGNISAWIHYASKRYYGLMGDGTYGTPTGVMSKRGYILSHYAKYTTGKTRIDAKWDDKTGALQGSSYISADGNQVVLMVINSSSNTYNLKVDLPFYTTSGTKVLTNTSSNMLTTSVSLSTQTFRPGVEITPSSVMTFVFNKSADRPVSSMTGGNVRYNKIETQTATNAAFGTAFNISNTTVTFSNPSPLISNNMTASNGYLQLNDRYNKLILHVNSYTTAGQSYSDNTTLYYINSQGVAKSYNYGRINFPSGGNFDITLDISRQVLTDGCKGILGLRNSNYSSVLTLNLGDVYFNVGNEIASKFNGTYSDSDSNLMDGLENGYYTSLDFRTVSGITASNNWQPVSVNTNSIFYVNSNVSSSASNVISGTTCSNLVLSDQGKDFHVPFNFTAGTASYNRTFNGYEVLLLPFEANIPSGMNVYLMSPGTTAISCTPVSNGIIPANIPVLVDATGNFTFTGTGNVSTPKAITVNQMNGVYHTIKVPANAYVLKTENGVTGFYKVAAGSEPMINPFRAYLTEENTFSANVLPLNFSVLSAKETELNQSRVYPNPAKTEIFVELKSRNATASIYDSKGSLIRSGLKMNSGKNRIDVSAFTSGVYFIELSDDSNQVTTHKFIKN
ncbi:T9SS C-terminal target domain-containing protein [Chryseobacterium shandongense]|uniref:T9SS C-terminal target domain-containing protein n=1 Tax=Chryseobacterium shandongense TaxID=1493872 RepID=A0AAD0YCM6_9FLAO|nr:T9SS type A sorting domain-containing protein [Chryseobacterium shandongense]AZA86004.1 T9SS C-terminal target domain-containing protein [Chryseobacterium shandongense]AZA94412.1 T9SS C-terminal target domain-containing protein [Chryseobacterium shandongense]